MPISIHEKEQIELMKRDVASWLSENRFTIFGTLTYRNPQHIRRHKAHRDAAHYMRLLSIKVLGREVVDRQNTYLPSLTFVEQGKQRDNTHIHFFIKGYTLQNEKDISYYSYRIWDRQYIDNANNVVLKAQYEGQRLTYGLKEQHALDDEIISPKACFIPTKQKIGIY